MDGTGPEVGIMIRSWTVCTGWEGEGGRASDVPRTPRSPRHHPKQKVEHSNPKLFRAGQAHPVMKW